MNTRTPSRLRVADLFATGTVGPRSRPMRTLLSALGISIGIASIVGVLGITSSSEAALLARIDRLGTNLLTVVNGQSLEGDEVALPPTAPGMIRRIQGVKRLAPTAELQGQGVFRSDRVPAYEGGGLALRVADTSLLSTLRAHVAAGSFLNPATERFPVTVLGWQAARGLGIDGANLPQLLWIGGHWFSVAGVLAPVPLAPEIDSSALIGGPVARSLFRYQGHPTRIYVRTAVASTASVASLLAATADPQQPDAVNVSNPASLLAARVAVAGASTALFLALGAIALLVGGIGIANVMLIGVLERRSEIGLRRALGASRRHVAAQFLVESLLVSAIGGLAGVAAGVAITTGMANARGWHTQIPTAAVWGALAVTAAIGALAGLYPSMRAARLSPTEALRTV